MKKTTKESVNHPAHYGGGENLYEAIKVIEAWGLGFCLGNTVKYICRVGKKDDMLQELKKARWYLDREIGNLEKLKSKPKREKKNVIVSKSSKRHPVQRQRPRR